MSKSAKDGPAVVREPTFTGVGIFASIGPIAKTRDNCREITPRGVVRLTHAERQGELR